LAIHVGVKTPGLVIKRDDKTVDPATWAMALPVDPGVHIVKAEAPNRRSWSKSANVIEPGQTLTVNVPELEHEASSQTSPPPSADRPREERQGSGLRKAAGIGLTGAGLIAVGVGSYFGLAAIAQYDRAKSEHGAARTSDSETAARKGNISTVLVIAGSFATAGGLVLWLTAPSGDSAVGTNGREVFVRGRF